MTKLKVGDRVRVFGWSSRVLDTTEFTADVIEILSANAIKVISRDYEITVHPKQCRKLVLKKRNYPKEIWGNVYRNHCISAGYRTKKEADKYAGGNRIACIRYVVAKDQKNGNQL